MIYKKSVLRNSEKKSIFKGKPMDVERKRLERNLERLGQIQPQLTIEIGQADCSSIKFSKTKNGELNFCREIDGKETYYHSNYNAAREAGNWFNSLDLKEVDALYVYGVGAGHYYDAVKPWLDESVKRYLVFIEDDIAILRKFLETEKATEILHNPQVQVHFLKDYESSEPMLQWLSWFFVLLPIEVSALQFYKKNRLEQYNLLRGKLFHDSVRKDSLASEFMRFSGGFYKNYYSNLSLLPEAFHGVKLFDCFKRVPAIICGAGPSLNKNIDQLKGLSNNALVFAGGSSLNALNYKGIQASFGAGIDPNPPQYDRLIKNFSYELPFFYRGRMLYEACKLIHGPHLYLNGAGGYFISEWFEENLDMEGEVIDEGYNVVNFTVEIARYLGCDPIIFVGMDLAFSELQTYADGIVKNTSVDEKKIVEEKGMSNAAFQRYDVFGKPTYTLWKWVTESDWIGKYAKEHPEITFVNATEGGIGFPGVPNLLLSGVQEKYLTKEYDLKQRIHCAIQKGTLPQVTRESVKKLMEEMAESLERCHELCHKLFEEIDSAEKRLKDRKKVDVSALSGRSALYEAELTEEPAYDYIISTMSSACTKILERKLMQVEYDKSLRSDLEKNLAKLDVNRTKMKYLRDASAVNLEILHNSLKCFNQQKEKVNL